MLRQGSTHIAPQTVFELAWRFRKTLLLTHKCGTAWAIEMTADSKEWSELPIGANQIQREKFINLLMLIQCYQYEHEKTKDYPNK